MLFAQSLKSDIWNRNIGPNRIERSSRDTGLLFPCDAACFKGLLSHRGGSLRRCWLPSSFGATSRARPSFGERYVSARGAYASDGECIHHPLHCGVLAVFHLDPMLRSAALVGPLASRPDPPDLCGMRPGNAGYTWPWRHSVNRKRSAPFRKSLKCVRTVATFKRPRALR
jgi:hypothetical protein